MRNMFGRYLLFILTCVMTVMVFIDNDDEKVRKIIASNTEVVHSSTTYYETRYDDDIEDIQVISSKEEYDAKVNSERVSSLGIERCESDNGSLRGSINMGANAIPTVSLYGVNNGGTTTQDVRVTYSLYLGLIPMYYGAAYSINEGSYTSFASNTVFSASGDYTIHVWNDLGDVYCSFKIAPVPTAGESTLWTGNNSYLAVHSVLRYRPNDNFATIETIAQWDVLPNNFYRDKQFLYVMCRDANFDFYPDGYSELEMTAHYNYDHYQMGGYNDIHIVNGEEHSSPQLTLYENLSSSLFADSSNQNVFLNFSTNSPLPRDHDNYVSLDFDWSVKTYLDVTYRMSVQVSLQNPNATMATYNQFALTSFYDNASHQFIDINGGVVYGNTIANTVDITVVLLGLPFLIVPMAGIAIFTISDGLIIVDGLIGMVLEIGGFHVAHSFSSSVISVPCSLAVEV